MATLQHQFIYEGNASEVPFNQVGLKLEIPAFEYITIQNNEGRVSHPYRNSLGIHYIKFFQTLKSESYSVIIPNQYMIGNTDRSVLNFWKYLKGIPKDLDSLSFQASLSVTHEADVLKQDSIEVIYSLATSSTEYKKIVAAEIALSQGVSLNPIAAKKVVGDIIKYTKENIILINKNAFAKVAEEFKRILPNQGDYPLLAIISHLTDATMNKPVLNINQAEFIEFLRQFGITGTFVQVLIDLVKVNFEDLFNFPISVPKIITIEIKGDIKFLSLSNEIAHKIDLINYDLFVQYNESATDLSRTVKYRWEKFTYEPIADNTEIFNFRENNDFVLIASQASTVTVTLRLADNTLLQSKTFDALDSEGLDDIHFIVDLFKLPQPDGTGTQNPDNRDQQLKGKVLELSGKCSLKDLTVIVQAKEKKTDPLWKIVGSATTDSDGNFRMKYPFGVFEEAQAIVSLTPDSPVDIPVYTDSIHTDAKQTISSDFLFLLVKDANCVPEDKTTTGDSGGNPKPRTSRLPNQEDLINSGEFSQDLAAGTCVNLTTPNRTLSETTYSAIVRTSEPDVANYVLEKNVSFDATDPLNYDKNKVTFTLTDGQRVERQPVDLDNPIRWQDAPDTNSDLSFYQAVQVAHGHLLRYKVVWKADGYSLGDLLYSLPLAPGQKKQIVINELKRTLQGIQQQQLVQREGLNASIINDRSIIDSLSGSINESLRGRSSASTGGVSAGLGIGFIAGAVGGVLGVSGGFANAGSTASQDSARNITQSFSEVLRNSISQSANAYRELNGTIIETVTEGQQYSTTSEVIANHNHCHSLTMLYFEVLRHYAVYQELVQIEECLFVPLLMTHFSTENIYKWRDVLAANLLTLPSETYLQPSITLGTGLQHPLIKAFDAIERIITKYSNVDYPEGAFDDESIREVFGEMNVRINFGRPKTRYDRIKSWPLVKEDDTHHFWAAVGGLLAGPLGAVVGGIFDSDGNIKIEAQSIIDDYIEVNANYASVPPAQSIRVKFIDELFFDNDETSKRAWISYANLLEKQSVESLLNEFFKNQLVSDWDSIFYDAIAPMLVKKLADNIHLKPFNTDFTVLGKYKGGEQIIKFNFGGTTNLTRKLITQVDLVMNSSQTIASDLTTIIVENISIRYATNHYNGTIFSGYLGNDLSSNDPVTKVTPESADEKRNPRKEDIFIVNALISHLNSNLEYYNKVLWYTLDPNRRYLLLDGFNIEVFNDLISGIVNKSLASVVKNELIGIVGNSLIFPVAAGVKLDRQNIIIHPPDVEGDNLTPSQSELNLFDHYKPLTPILPYRISVPTRGIYAEAIQGACDACEKVKADTSQDWDKFKPDEPTAINPVTVGVPTPTEFRPQFKDFATPIVNIQNAPAAPAPGAGLAGLSDLLGKAGIFKDITGLDANQQNAIKTYLSNQENAKAFAEMAKEMSMQGHNTEHADKIADAIRNSPELSKEEKAQLLKDHFGQMIDGGQSKKAEEQNAQNSKPSLTDAAVKAADQGKGVKAQKIDKDGNTESVDISSSPTSENILAAVKGAIPNLKQDNENACWATAATIMMSWKKERTLKVEEVLAEAGDTYLQKFNNKESLKSSEKEDFITKLTMIGEPPASYPLQKYVDWVKNFGPLWITTDSSDEAGEFSPHARILVKITGTGTPDGVGTDFTFIDPATGSQKTQHFNDFLKEYEQMVTDNPSDNLFIQIVHFKDEIAGEGKSAAQEAAEIAQNWADLENLANNSCERRIINFIKTQQWLNVKYNSTRDGPIIHLGYVVGMALMYARLYCRLSKGERFATEMSKAPVDSSTLDALNQYDLEFTTGRNGNPGLNITDHSSGKATLRKVFTLLFGLGMQESSGDYSVGFDPGKTPDKKEAKISEAGAFQISWSIGVENPENEFRHIRDLYTIYKELQDEGSLLDFFKIGRNKRSNPTAHKAVKESPQDAAKGVNFQKLIYKSPAFSVELAALGIRFRRNHFGTLDNEREATLKRECYDMFQSIETIMDENSCCTEMGFIRTSYNAISDIETGILATDIAIATDALWIVGKDRLDSKFKLIRYDKATLLHIGLASVFDDAKKITVDNNNNPCVIDKQGNIFITKANAFIQFTNEKASDISIESNGTIWIVGTSNEDINGFEIKKHNKLTSSWDVIVGKAMKILIAQDDTPWVMNKQGELFSFDSGTWNKQNTVEKVTDFAIGSNNEIWIIGEINTTTQNGRIFKLLNSGDWISYDGSGVAIEIDLTTGLPYVIDDSGLILKMNPQSDIPQVHMRL
ncbi:MAG: papain-like cysteine protease family protein [Methanosarcina sp.]